MTRLRLAVPKPVAAEAPAAVERQERFAAPTALPLSSRPLGRPTAALGAPESAPARTVSSKVDVPVLRVPVRAPQEVAREGLSGSAGRLPFLDPIQRSFGPYDVRGVPAFTGPAARRAAAGLQADAYTTEGSVVFGERPSLFAAAHEAAHVVQQRGDVRLPGGLGRTGDLYERHANAVASRVVRGEPAAGLLAGMADAAAQTSQPGLIQRIGASYLPLDDGPNAHLAAAQNPAQVGNVAFDNVADEFYDGINSQPSDEVYLEDEIDLYSNDDPADDKELARTRDINPYLGQIDHIVPRALGGGTSFLNAQLVSARRNNLKNDEYPDPISGLSGSRIYLGTRKWDMAAGTILNVDPNDDLVQLDDSAYIPTQGNFGGNFTLTNPHEVRQNLTNNRVAVQGFANHGREVWVDKAVATNHGFAPAQDLPED